MWEPNIIYLLFICVSAGVELEERALRCRTNSLGDALLSLISLFSHKTNSHFCCKRNLIDLDQFEFSLLHLQTAHLIQPPPPPTTPAYLPLCLFAV